MEIGEKIEFIRIEREIYIRMILGNEIVWVHVLDNLDTKDIANLEKFRNKQKAD